MSTILILEADTKTSDILKAQLEKNHYEVLLFNSFDESANILQTMQPDAFLIDLNVANPQFTQFYGWISTNPGLSQIPRIFLVGNSKKALAEQLLRQAPAKVLDKPLRMSGLLGALREVMPAPVPPGQPAFPMQQVAPQYQYTMQQAPAQYPMQPQYPGQPPYGVNPAYTQQYPPHTPPPPAQPKNPEEILTSLIGRQIGSVEIVKEIGRGGMGAVFEGKQVSLERQVAVKIMLPDLVGQTTALERFKREALAIARLKSPNIVQVFDAGSTPDNIFYIVMEFLEGETLDEHLSRSGKYTLDKALDIVVQTAKGLQEAHRVNLTHRDLKPSNLMIDGQGHITITDFGLVRGFGSDDHKLTKTAALVGTPYYLSPEQAAGSAIDTRTDLYSLGIVFYELLTGEMPFVSENLLDILMMHYNEPLPDPRKLVPSIPEPIIKILDKLTQKKPDDRFQSADLLLHELENFRRGLSTSQQNYRVPTTGYGIPQPSGNTPTPGFIPGGPGVGSSHGGFNAANLSQSLMSAGIITQDAPSGSATAGPAGNIITSHGNFPDTWRNALSHSVGFIQQARSISTLGEWQYGLLESEKQILYIQPEKDTYEGVLMQPSSFGHSMSLDTHNTPSTTGLQQHDPIAQILSVAGVDGLLLFAPDGQLERGAFHTPSLQNEYHLRLNPLPQVLQGIPVDIAGFDLIFENGRVLSWLLEERALFVVARLELNKMILTTILARHFGKLQLQHKNSSDSSMDNSSFDVKIPTGPVLEVSKFKALQKAYARVIGPIAKMAIKQEAKKMGYSRKAFPENQAQALIDRLAARLDESKQDDFIRTGIKLLLED